MVKLLLLISKMRVITKNKTAYSDYDIQQEYDAGVVLA